jgi:hypothetical protein
MPFTRRDLVKTAFIGTVLASVLEVAPAIAEGMCIGEGTIAAQ